MIRSSYQNTSQRYLSKTKYMPSHHILLIKGGFESHDAKEKLDGVLANAKDHLRYHQKLSFYLEIYDIDTKMVKFLFDMFRLLQQNSYMKKVTAFWIIKNDDDELKKYIQDFTELFNFPIQIEIED